MNKRGSDEPNLLIVNMQTLNKIEGITKIQQIAWVSSTKVDHDEAKVW